MLKLQCSAVSLHQALDLVLEENDLDFEAKKAELLREADGSSSPPEDEQSTPKFNDGLRCDYVLPVRPPLSCMADTTIMAQGTRR